MTRQEQGIREQGPESLARLLKNAVPPVGDDIEPAHDLWPMMQLRLKNGGDVAAGIHAVPWLDWVLAGGVAVCAMTFPAMIPVLLYYL